MSKMTIEILNAIKSTKEVDDAVSGFLLEPNHSSKQKALEAVMEHFAGNLVQPFIRRASICSELAETAQAVHRVSASTGPFCFQRLTNWLSNRALAICRSSSRLS
jgi:hypothetical protein